MAYEFKKLSEVEVVAEPTESANVLIEEDGVIKKAPKTAVGGGNTEWDAIIECIEGASGFFDSIELLNGSFIDLKEKIFAGILPKTLIRYINGSSAGFVAHPTICYWAQEDLIQFEFLCCNGNIRNVKLYSDGHMEN